MFGQQGKVPSEDCRGTLEKGTEPTNAQIGPCDELATHPGMDPAFAHCVSILKMDKYLTLKK